MRLSSSLVFFAALGLGACNQETSSGAAGSPQAPGSAVGSLPVGDARPLVVRSAAPAPTRELPPLKGSASIELAFESESGGALTADVAVPVGAVRAQPILAVLTTEKSPRICDGWRSVRGAQGFFICLPEIRDVQAGVARFKKAIGALKEQFGEHIGERSTIVGYGEAALSALHLMRESPVLFSRGLLVHSEPDAISFGFARAFAAQGGERVLWACEGCDTTKAITTLTREGVQAKSFSEEPSAEGQIQAAWAALSEGDVWWGAAAK